MADKHFIETVGRRLTEKYEKPHSQTGDVFHWSPIERVRHGVSEAHPFTTMWMTAYIGGFGSDPTLEITMIDFRVLWATKPPQIVSRAKRQRAAFGSSSAAPTFEHGTGKRFMPAFDPLRTFTLNGYCHEIAGPSLHVRQVSNADLPMLLD